MILMMTKGLPGSGKSTWAEAWVAEDPDNRARVNQDDLRAMLRLGEWNYDKEQRVRAVRNSAIGALLRLGLSVVSDDTNLARRAQSDLKNLAIRHSATLLIHDLTWIPLEDCIQHDAARDNPVGEDVIRGMHKRFLS